MLKKEKNFIIYEKEEGKIYKLDINKGRWYGLKGQELTNVPPLFSQQLQDYDGEDVLIKCLKNTIDWNYCSCKRATTEYVDNLAMLDKTINFLSTINKKLAITYVNNSELIHLKTKDYLKKYGKELKEKLAEIDYSKWFFEDDTYITVFPKSKQDFIVEGQKQNNCVGGYSSYVLEGCRIVTFIRRKDNIEKPLVTCDICNINKGCTPYINQFLKAHNSYVSQKDDVYDFYLKYREYIESLT